MTGKFRVIQMGLGAAGRRTAGVIANKKTMELVGAIDIASDTVGRDVGEVVGLGRKIGVMVSNDVDAVLATPADLVMHMTPSTMYSQGDWSSNVKEIEKIMAAGKNVITTTGFLYPWLHSPEMSNRLDACAKAHGVTLLGSGCNPGYVSDLLPLVLAGSMVRVDKVHFSRGADHTNYDSWSIARDMLGYGLSPEEFDTQKMEPYRKFMHQYFLESAHIIASALHWEIDECKPHVTRYLAREEVRNICLVAQPGTVCALTICLEAFRKGEPVIVIEWSGILCPEKTKEYTPKPGEHIRIDGSPSTGVDFTGEHPEQPLEVTAAVTANYVPLVVKAESGFKNMLELPMLTFVP